jgi:hypothetical protein
MDAGANMIRDPGSVATSAFACSSFLKCALRMFIKLNAIPTTCISFETTSVSVSSGVHN